MDIVRAVLVVAAALTVVAPALAAKAEVPLIPREVLFGNPDKAAPRVSPDGTRIAYLAPLDGVLNVWVAPVSNLKAAKAITADKGRGIQQFFWAYTNKHLLYLQDKNGDENWRIYAVNLETGATKDLTPLEGVNAQVSGLSERVPGELIVGLNDRVPQLHDLYRMNIETGEKTLLVKNPGFVGFITDDDLKVRFAMTMTPDGQRLVPLRFEEDSMIGSWFRKKTTTFDYARHKVIAELKKSGEKSRKEIDIPDGVVYDDPVTAFYNFRAGVYGKVEPGRDVLIHTVPGKKSENILRLSVLAKEAADKRRAAEEDKAGKDLLVRVQMDRETLSSKKGELEVWFDHNLVPVSGVVKDVRLFGDIRGKRTYPGSAGAKAD